MAFASFEDIEAWKEARSLMRLVRKFTKRAVAKKDWAWADQISRATVSIMANIAEGNDATTNPEFIMFLGYAKRSAAEVRSLLYPGLDDGYVLEKEFEEASAMTKKIGAQLAKLMRYLHEHTKPNRIGTSKPATPLPSYQATNISCN
ncbi:four helix bundle protein [Candidatus Peregrinibacteria bacterium]|nr:four helix bundle protein [Candidatus Peregrinibacteria bacterium]